MGNYMGRNDTGGHPMRFLKLKEVMEKTALSRSAIYRKMDKKNLKMDEKIFPKPVNLGDRAVAWVESEVNEWMEWCLDISR
jgi:prophage regulatory protein